MQPKRPGHARAAASYSSIFGGAPRHYQPEPSRNTSAPHAPTVPHPLEVPSGSSADTPLQYEPGASSIIGVSASPSTSHGSGSIASANVIRQGAANGIGGPSGAARRPPGLRARSTAPYIRSADVRRTSPSPILPPASQLATQAPEDLEGIVPGAFVPTMRPSEASVAPPSSSAATATTVPPGRARTHILDPAPRISVARAISRAPHGNGVGNGHGSGVGARPQVAHRISRMQSRDRDRAKAKPPAHLPLHRRLLFPTLPIDSPLPPIVLGTGPAIEALNERLYTLIALLLRAYILSWYPLLTKDRTLLPHLTQTILAPLLSPILTGVYEHPERMVELVALDLPRVVGLHVGVYWEARAGVERAGEMGLGRVEGEVEDEGRGEIGDGDEGSADKGGESCEGTAAYPAQARLPELQAGADEIALGRAYHARLPLTSIIPYEPPPPASLADPPPAADPSSTPSAPPAPPSAHLPTPPLPAEPYRTPLFPSQQTLSPIYLTTLADSILRLHLPPKEYASEVQRIMGREILGRVVLGGVARKLGEAGFWLALGLRVLGEPDAGNSRAGDAEVVRPAADGRPDATANASFGATVKSFFVRIWTAIAATTLLAITLISSMRRMVAMLAFSTSALPDDVQYSGVGIVGPWIALGRAILGIDGRGGLYPAPWALRMAWGAVEAGLTLASPLFDRFVPRLLAAYLTPQLSIILIDKVEAILLPANGYPGPAEPDPTPDEVADMRQRLERRLCAVVPSWVYTVPSRPTGADIDIDPVTATTASAPAARKGSDSQQQSLPARHCQSASTPMTSTGIAVASPIQMIQPFLSPGCNAHLIGMGLEAIVGALVPELVVTGRDAADHNAEPPFDVAVGPHDIDTKASLDLRSDSRQGWEPQDGEDAIGLRWRTARRAGALADAMGLDQV